MHRPNLYFFGAMGIFLSILVLIAGYYYWRHRRSSPATFEALFAQLKWIDRNNIAQVALDLSGQPMAGEADATLEPSQLWNLIGGLDGLELMERNSEVLIALAFYVQQWYPEALLVAEQLRLNAREVEWHIGRLKATAKSGRPPVAAAEYLQQAVAIYYHMTREVLALYEQANLPGLADLQRAL